MTNRNPVKQLFLTFPHSTVDKCTFRDQLLRFEPDYYSVCEEKHKDGTPHLHAVVRFKNKYSKAYVVKYFKELYPEDYKRIDVKPVRSIKNSIAYLSKEDTSPLTSGEFKDARQPQNNHLSAFARELGFNSVDILVEYHRQETARRNHYKDLVNKKQLSFLQYQNSFPFRVNQILDQLFRDYPIAKDDITFLNNYFSIEYESSTRGEFPMVITETPQ